MAVVRVQVNTIERFLIWRRRRGWSQRMTARQLGVHRTTIQRMERGEVVIPIKNLPEIASPGEELWLMRRRHGLTKAQAAAVLDCSVTQLYRLEHDKATLQYRDLTDIEAGYRTTL